MTTRKTKPKKSPAAKAKPTLIEGAGKLAAVLDVSRVTVDAWINRGMPVHRRSTVQGEPHVFDPAACRAWLANEGLQQDTNLDAPKSRAEADHALVLQKIRAARAGADKAELGLKVRKGELLEAADVERGRLERIAAVTSALEAMPGKLAPELVGRDARAIQARLAEEVTRIREEFAREPEKEKPS